MASSYFMLRILRRKRNSNKLSQADLDIISAKTSSSNNDIDNICRICLKVGLIPIYYDDLKCNTTAKAIQTFGDINVSEDDDYPKHLCETCHSLLQGAILFRKLATESDYILHQTQIKQKKSDFVTDTSNYFSNNESNCDFQDNENIELPKLYNCKTCSLNFITIDEYTKHKSSKQHKNIRIQCTICKKLLTQQLYRRHLSRHQSTTHLICDVCGKLYRKDNLVRHLQLHSFDLPFQCQLCPYRGRFMESLRIHMRTHTGDKPFSCDKCHLRFLTRSNLSRHLLTHKKERPFKCVECGRGFYTRRDMDAHFKSDHVGIKDYSCRLCGSKYGTRKALMRHELRVHKRDKMARGRMPLYKQAEYQK